MDSWDLCTRTLVYMRACVRVLACVYHLNRPHTSSRACRAPRAPRCAPPCRWTAPAACCTASRWSSSWCAVPTPWLDPIPATAFLGIMLGIMRDFSGLFLGIIYSILVPPKIHWKPCQTPIPYNRAGGYHCGCRDLSNEVSYVFVNKPTYYFTKKRVFDFCDIVLDPLGPFGHSLMERRCLGAFLYAHFKHKKKHECPHKNKHDKNQLYADGVHRMFYHQDFFTHKK